MFKKTALATTFVLAASAISTNAMAWGDEGHEIVGLIASHYLKPTVMAKVTQLLETDPTQLTATDIEHEATWADKYRDSDRNTTKVRYNLTHNWHFVDIEIHGGNLDKACFRHPAPSPTGASNGPANDCVVDKINEFASELKAPGTSAAERRLDLQFLLHFVGDVHQPLHASDDHDQGGNAKLVTAAGEQDGKLHGYWDTQFVQRLGTDPTIVANSLIARISAADEVAWAKGRAADWAQEAYQLSVSQVYATLPAPGPSGVYALPASYVTNASQVVAQQLSKAGVRLASVLNAALGQP